MEAKVIRTKEPEVSLGTVTFSKPYSSNYHNTVFEKDSVVSVSKVLPCLAGQRFYKIFGTTLWISDNEVYNVNVANVPKRRTVKIYSA
jgi:hypothetical protein